MCWLVTVYECLVNSGTHKRSYDQELSQAPPKVGLKRNKFLYKSDPPCFSKKALVSPSELLYRLCTAILMIVAKPHLQMKFVYTN